MEREAERPAASFRIVVNQSRADLWKQDCALSARIERLSLGLAVKGIHVHCPGFWPGPVKVRIEASIKLLQPAWKSALPRSPERFLGDEVAVIEHSILPCLWITR